MRGALVVLAIVLATAALTEGVSFVIVKGYGWLRYERVPDDTGTTASGEPSGFVTDAGVLADNRAFIQSGYRFTSYAMYANPIFRSRFVNVGVDGIRSNGFHAPKDAARRYTIWMLGSSALFGVPADADDETLPAYLERDLNRNHPEVDIRVRNLGVVGYTSIQQLIQLKTRSLDERPDMIVLFDGYNDYYKIFYGSFTQDYITYEPLSYYWSVHNNGDLVLWRVVGSKILGLFSNTVALMDKARKWAALREARGDIEAWKRAYASRADRARAGYEAFFDKGVGYFIDNAEAISNEARRMGAKVILVQQPALIPAKKTLVGREIEEAKHFKLNHFALTPEELAAETQVQTYRVEQTDLFPASLFVDGYYEQNRRLKALAKRLGVGYLDAQGITDASDIPIYYDNIHLTPAANELLAARLAREVERVAAGFQSAP